jgi:hypothetical protein
MAGGKLILHQLVSQARGVEKRKCTIINININIEKACLWFLWDCPLKGRQGRAGRGAEAARVRIRLKKNTDKTVRNQV